jgi:electron transfer flavoprotein alpha subunit
MSVLVFIDQAEGLIKKSSFEAAYYASRTASLLGTTAEAIILGNSKEDLTLLGNYGISKVHTVTDEKLNHFDAQVYVKIIADAAAQFLV